MGRFPSMAEYGETLKVAARLEPCEIVPPFRRATPIRGV